MLVLLGVSTLAAALVPPLPEDDEETTTTTSVTSPRTSSLPAGGLLVSETLDAGAKGVERIRLGLGDQLVLRVVSPRPGEVAVPSLGLLADVAPLAPARFDILARREGRFGVRILDPPRRVGVIKVSEP